METSNCYYIYMYSHNSDQVENSIIRKKKKPAKFHVIIQDVVEHFWYC